MKWLKPIVQIKPVSAMAPALCNLQIIRTSKVALFVRGCSTESQQDTDPSSKMRFVEEEGDLDLNHLQDTSLQKKKIDQVKNANSVIIFLINL